MITVMTAVALTIGILMLSYVESRLVATTGESLALAAAEVADKLDRLIFERYMDSRILAQGFRQHIRDPSYLTTHLTWVRQSSPMYLWMGVTDARGVVIAATNPETVGHDYASEPWFHAARSGETHIGDVEPYEAAGGVDSIGFTAPILGVQEEFLGAVTAQMALPALEDVVTQAIHVFQDREGFLGTLEYQFLTREGDAFVDSDLAHKGNVNLKRMGLPSAQLLDFGQPGYVLERHLRRGVDVVTGYAKMEGRYGNYSLGWGVLLRVDRSDILAPIRRVLWRLAAAGSAVWVPMFVILLWATRRLRIEWAQARHESARARKAEATLREQNERFERVNQATNDWVWDWNVRTNDVWWNDKLEVLFGYSAKETPHSYEFWYHGMHPDDRERIAKSQEAVLQARERVWSGEYRFRRADGTYADVVDRAYALYDGDGTPQRMIGSVRDITESRQAVKRQAAQLAVSLALAESTTMQDAGPRFLQAVCDTTGWEFGALWLVDRPAKVLRCQTVWHRPDHDLGDFASISYARQFSMGLGLPGRVWASGQPSWIPDVVHDDNFPRAPAAAEVGLHAACGFPVMLGNEVIGVLEFFSYEIRQPDTQLLR
jgi:PAS domain S-box-containing protein